MPGRDGFRPLQRGHGGSGYWLTPGGLTGSSSVVLMNVSVCIGGASAPLDGVLQQRLVTTLCVINAAATLTFEE